MSEITPGRAGDALTQRYERWQLDATTSVGVCWSCRGYQQHEPYCAYALIRDLQADRQQLLSARQSDWTTFMELTGAATSPEKAIAFLRTWANGYLLKGQPWDVPQTMGNALNAAADSLEADRLLLREYVQHKPSCNALRWSSRCPTCQTDVQHYERTSMYCDVCRKYSPVPNRDCTCGLAALLTEVPQ